MACLIHRSRVAGRELPDLLVRQQPLDVAHLFRLRAAGGAEPVTQHHRPPSGPGIAKSTE
jgi:hypothetical protein